jgi:hypothetical protein
MKTTGVFDFEIGSGGVSIVPAKASMTNAALSDSELDGQIAAAKLDLDATAKRAKAALRKYLLQPLLGSN